ncbi:MAG: MFS transporter, partial [Pseudomonadota bacterium]
CMLADRVGTGLTLALGTSLYAFGLGLMAFTQTAGGLHISGGLLIGFGVGLTSFPIVLGAVGRMVPEASRSLALGIVSTGGSLGQFLLAPISGGFIAALGWSGALLALAALAILMAPAGFALAAQRTAGDSSQSQNPSPSEVPDAQTLGAAVRSASTSSSFWLLVAGFFVCGFHVSFIAVHLPTFVSLCGLTPQVGVAALTLIGLFNVFGGLLAGYLGGVLQKKYVLSGIYLARTAAILIFFALPKTAPVVLGFSAVIGLLWLSTVPLTSGLVASLFGTRYMATLYGFVMVGHQVGAFAGVWMGGAFFAKTGTYDAMWLISAGLGVFAAILHLPVAEKRHGALGAPVRP